MAHKYFLLIICSFIMSIVFNYQQMTPSNLRKIVKLMKSYPFNDCNILALQYSFAKQNSIPLTNNWKLVVSLISIISIIDQDQYMVYISLLTFLLFRTLNNCTTTLIIWLRLICFLALLQQLLHYMHISILMFGFLSFSPGVDKEIGKP